MNSSSMMAASGIELTMDVLIVVVVVVFLAALIFGIADFIMEVLTTEDETDPLPPLKRCEESWECPSFRVIAPRPYDWKEEHDGDLCDLPF